MGNEKKQTPKFTVILHEIRLFLDISFQEYILMDSIDKLSRNKMGYCYASKQTLGDFMGTTKRAVYKQITRLEEKGIVEKDERSRLRPTQLWYDAQLSGERQIDEEYTQEVVNDVHSTSEQRSPNDEQRSPNKNKNKNINNLIFCKNDKSVADKKVKNTEAKYIQELMNLFHSLNPMINFANMSERNALSNLINTYNFDKAKEIVKMAIQAQQLPYAPRITSPTALVRKLGDLKVFLIQENTRKKQIEEKVKNNRIKLHDGGGYAIKKFGEWVDEQSGAKINLSYYPYVGKEQTYEEYQETKSISNHSVS